MDVDLKVGIQTIQSWGLLPNEGESLYQYDSVELTTHVRPRGL